MLTSSNKYCVLCWVILCTVLTLSIITRMLTSSNSVLTLCTVLTHFLSYSSITRMLTPMYCVLCWLILFHIVPSHSQNLMLTPSNTESNTVCPGTFFFHIVFKHELSKSNAHWRGSRHSILNTLSVLSLSHCDISRFNAYKKYSLPWPGFYFCTKRVH